MTSKAEFERTIIRDIIANESLEGLPKLWLKAKLQKILDGEEPSNVFVRQKREVQKTQTKVMRAEIALKVAEEKLNGQSVQAAKEAVSVSLGLSYDSVDYAWKKYGKFVKETLPRESEA